MSKAAIFEYKCRRCGCVFDGPITAESNGLQFLCMIEGGIDPPGIPTRMTDIHTNCELLMQSPLWPPEHPRGLGVGDLIGLRWEDQL